MRVHFAGGGSRWRRLEFGSKWAVLLDPNSNALCRGPSQDLQGPQKGHFGPKRALLGPLWAKGRPNTRAKYMVTMTPTQSDQLAAVGTKSGPRGPPRPSGTPKRAFRGQNGPFWGPWSAVEVLKWAQGHDMGASHPDTLCGSVLDASQPVSAVPGTQRGP